MALNFPSSPSINQQYPPSPIAGVPTYYWDGEKWLTNKVVALASSETALPLMDGIAAPGTALTWSRSDHVHPTDTLYASTNSPTFTGTLTAPTFSMSGNLSVATAITATAKGQQFGTASGNTYGTPLATTDANMLFYTPASGNWCGIGTDPNGDFWIRTGGAGTNYTAAFVSLASNQFCGFSNAPYAPTRPNGSNDNYIATTAYVLANQPVGGPYLPLTGGTISGNFGCSYGHIMPYRNGPTGVLYFGTSGARYLYWDNSSGYIFAGNIVNTPAGRIWGNSDWVNPLINGRLLYWSDYTYNEATGFVEPGGGTAASGSTGCAWNYSPGAYGVGIRYRYNQIQIASGGWYTAGVV